MLYWKQYDHSVNIEKFKEYCLALRHRLKGRKIVLFMDNLSVHRSLKTRDYLSALGMDIIFNCAYSPEYNPIEFTFSQVKRIYKNLTTHKIVNFEKQDTFEMIQTAFKSIKIDAVQNCIDFSFKTMKNDLKI